MERSQRGLTILGFLFVAAVVVTIALVGFRVFPAYVEYYAVQKALAQALEESPTGNIQEIRRAFDRKVSAGYIESVRPSDVQVSRDGNKLVASVASALRIGGCCVNVSASCHSSSFSRA